MKLTVKQQLEQPFIAGRKLTVGEAIVNCHRLGRQHRRRISRFLSMNWKYYKGVEKVALGYAAEL